MARIAEELLLLLLDNASARPGLDSNRCARVLSGAVLLDLAHACRIRPAVEGDIAPEGQLMVLAGPDPNDPVLLHALQVLARRPLSPESAVAKLRRSTQPMLLTHLERTGQVTPMRLRNKRFKNSWSWPLTDRTRARTARSAVLSALFDGHVPTPSTAAIISLLYDADGLGALLSLNERGWQWVRNRAGDIASGGWVDEYPGAQLPEVNLAVTASAVRSALT